MRRPTTSAIWKYFKVNEQNREKSLCKICNKTYSRKGRTTTSLKKHLKSKHPKQFNLFQIEDKEKQLKSKKDELVNPGVCKVKEECSFMESYEEPCGVSETSQHALSNTVNPEVCRVKEECSFVESYEEPSGVSDTPQHALSDTVDPSVCEEKEECSFMESYEEPCEVSETPQHDLSDTVNPDVCRVKQEANCMECYEEPSVVSETSQHAFSNTGNIMETEQFSLCWDNFHKNMSIGMNTLLEGEEFVDVTLACEGKYLKAHKMVLSVCSPYFKELFKVNPCQHPIVLMKDISYVAMKDLLQFMYQGEVQVSQENLTTFIKTAEALQIKGLTADGNTTESEEITTQVTNKRSINLSKPQLQQPKRISSPPPLVLSVPPAKRQRVSSIPSPNVETNCVSTTPSLSSKIENITTIETTVQNSNDIQLKFEPEQNDTKIVDESLIDESFNTEEQLMDDKNADDTNDDDNVMENVDDEPQAGTSTEGLVAEGQDCNIQYTVQEKGRPKKRINRMKFVVDGFVYHNNVIAGSPPLRYLGCAEHKRSGCRGRASIPVGGSLDMLRVTQPHNHPPDVNAEEKYAFIKELKKAVVSPAMEKIKLKKVYETIAVAFPKAAEEIPFKSLSSSLHRWRRDN